MNVYQDLEDCLYNVLEGLFPEWRTIFAFGNGPEPLTPYCAIDVKKIEPIGREYQSSLSHLDPEDPERALTVTIQDNCVYVRFELIGQADQNTTVAEQVAQLMNALRTPKGYELMARNRLALHSKMATRRIPQKRETQMFMVYQLDCTFAYSDVTTDEIDWIETVGLHATYYDAGREPDHIIDHDIDLTPP